MHIPCGAPAAYHAILFTEFSLVFLYPVFTSTFCFIFSTPISPHPPQDLSLSPSPRTTPKLVPREPTIPLAGGKGTPREPTIPLAGGKGTPLEPTIPLAGGKGTQTSDYEMLDITQAIEELDPRRRQVITCGTCVCIFVCRYFVCVHILYVDTLCVYIFCM